MTDRSNGYEGVAAEFLARRGCARTRSKGIGVKAVREWARTLPRRAAVIDLGCGPGFPITEVLVMEGLNVYAIDASPSFVEAFRRNLPGIPVTCEAVEDSTFFDRRFNGVIAWGLMFLLSAEEQRRLIQRVADILVPGGRLLFTSCVEPLVWKDAMTGLESRSLGAVEYRSQQYFSWWTMRNPYMSPDDARWFQELEQIVRSNPESTEGYIKTLGDGMRYSGRSTLSTMLATELPTTASTLKVPFFVIQGREDMVTPTSVAVKYFNVVKAPKKKLILIEHAGHFVLVTHREEFLAALVKNVRPLAIKSE